MPQADVTIIGAGLAGLCCARRLHQCGIPFRVLETSDGVGGRVRTDRVDGFQLDRGFQVYLPAYPEGQRVLDLPALDLRPFTKGALVRFRGRFHRVSDPSEGLVRAALSLLNPIGTARDKLRVGRLASRYLSLSQDKLAGGSNGLTLDELRWAGGFSPAIIERFFRPWLGGVTLDPSLKTSARFLRFVFRMFAEGGAALPAAGMEAIPRQIAAGLPADAIVLNEAVESLAAGEAVTNDGSAHRTRATVVATDGRQAARLLGGELPEPAFHGTAALYYAADTSPVGEPTLVLNGEGQGVVNHLAVISDVAPSYAPAGKSLICANTVGVPAMADDELERAVRGQLAGWYGSAVQGWQLLRVQRVPLALPDQGPEALDPWERPVRIRPGLYVCGDHRDQASINGAMASGFRAAQAVADDLHAGRC